MVAGRAGSVAGVGKAARRVELASCRAGSLAGRVGNFRQKNNSAGDGIDRTNGYFQPYSGCSSEQKTLGIPFQTLSRKRKQLGIPFRAIKIEANSRNSVPHHSAEEKLLRAKCGSLKFKK